MLNNNVLFHFCEWRSYYPHPAKKGLRQGDPMSPVRFALGMEYLSRCLQEVIIDEQFHFHPRCKRLEITHMMFTDDLLLFSRADKPSVQNSFEAFSKYPVAWGLVANLDKSDMYMAGVSDVEEVLIRSGLGMGKGSFPFRYLGVHLTTRKLSYADNKPLVDKTVARAINWSAKFLKYAGRLQLIYF